MHMNFQHTIAEQIYQHFEIKHNISSIAKQSCVQNKNAQFLLSLDILQYFLIYHGDFNCLDPQACSIFKLINEATKV